MNLYGSRAIVLLPFNRKKGKKLQFNRGNDKSGYDHKGLAPNVEIQGLVFELPSLLD